MSNQDPGPSSEIPPLPDITVETTARGFFKQAKDYGFRRVDFVRLVNIFLDLLMGHDDASGEVRSERSRIPRTEHENLPIVGREVTIRPFGEAGDRELLDAWVATESGRLFLLSTASGRAHDVDELVASRENRLGIIVQGSRPIGCLAYLDYNLEQRRAELRKMIGIPELRGRGLGREAAALWVGYGIGALGLKKIYLNTLATDIGNIRINEEIGFVVEGILRNEVLIDGTYRDVLRMGLWHG
jgi:RimJ/RimL family protein N-acetyltransferase